MIRASNEEPVGHTRSSLAADAPMPSDNRPECPHDQVDWSYVVEDRGPVSILEGTCVQCDETVRGEQHGRGGETVDRRRAH